MKHKLYTVKHLGNVIEGNQIKYLNVETNDMKNAAISSLKNDEPVWFGCDVSKHFHRDLGVMILIYLIMIHFIDNFGWRLPS